VKVADPDILLAVDGHVYVAASALPLAARAGRRVLRVLALTPREEDELRRRVASLAGDLLVALPGGKRGVR
jgi:hypothetical protein